MLAGGIVRTNVDPAQVARVAATLPDSGCEAVAVCLLHSYGRQATRFGAYPMTPPRVLAALATSRT
jgi:hypothetical protein